MKIIADVQQGSDAWLAHRRTTRNASEAPSVMGASPYVTRSQLIRQRASGIEREIDPATQRIFDRGHEVEPALRSLAEKIIGEDLYPVTATSDDGRLGASFDGVTLAEDVIFEAKQHNAEKRASICAGEIPSADYWQIVQQFAVCESATQCLYLCGDGSEGNTAQLWIERAQVEADIPKLLAAWDQFDADVAAYVPEPTAAPIAAGRAPDQMPALRIEVTGMVTASNLAEWKDQAIAVFKGISTELTTDQDFADAEKTVKWCGDIEDQLKGAKQHALSQTASIDELFRTIDAISEEARATRLKLDKLVKARKEERRVEIGNAARRAVLEHVRAINDTLGEHALPMPATLVPDIGAAMKGKKSFSSMEDAVSAVAANAKIAASQAADRVRSNIAILAEHPEHSTLFADRVQLCAGKAPDDLRNLVAARIAEHQQREADRLEKERARIRQEEVDRLEREQREEAARIERERAAAELAAAKRDPEGAELSPAAQQLNEAEGAQRFAQRHPAVAKAEAATPGARIKLGDICARIAPLTITADGLASLGFNPVASERGAKLYTLASLPAMFDAMTTVLTRAADHRKAA